jgi:hypothetical protein
MDPSQWLAGFRGAHERAKKGALQPDEKQAYLAMREELARSLLAAQGMMIPDGQNARQHFRVAHVFPVELSNQHASATRDISRTGFSATVAADFKVGENVSFKLTLVRGTDPVAGTARVISAVKQVGNARVSFAFGKLSEADAERLEVALFDAVLQRFK